MKMGFSTILHKFDSQGEKTGWTYINIPKTVTEKIKPGNKKSFRVKGSIDEYPINKTALLPMGGGAFIMPVNASMRKAIKKQKGAIVKVEIEEDHSPVKNSASLLTCLKDEPEALEYFKKLPLSHQHYYSKWIDSAKTDTTKAKRITMAVNAMSKKLNFSAMLQMKDKYE